MPDIRIGLEEVKQQFYTDFNLYEGIFFHIVSNAIKFTPSGSRITVEVGVTPWCEEELPQQDNQNPLS